MLFGGTLFFLSGYLAGIHFKKWDPILCKSGGTPIYWEMVIEQEPFFGKWSFGETPFLWEEVIEWEPITFVSCYLVRHYAFCKMVI